MATADPIRPDGRHLEIEEISFGEVHWREAVDAFRTLAGTDIRRH